MSLKKYIKNIFKKVHKEPMPWCNSAAWRFPVSKADSRGVHPKTGCCGESGRCKRRSEGRKSAAPTFFLGGEPCYQLATRGCGPGCKDSSSSSSGGRAKGGAGGVPGRLGARKGAVRRRRQPGRAPEPITGGMPSWWGAAAGPQTTHSRLRAASSPARPRSASPGTPKTQLAGTQTSPPAAPGTLQSQE